MHVTNILFPPQCSTMLHGVSHNSPIIKVINNRNFLHLINLISIRTSSLGGQDHTDHSGNIPHMRPLVLLEILLSSPIFFESEKSLLHDHKSF